MSVADKFEEVMMVDFSAFQRLNPGARGVVLEQFEYANEVCDPWNRFHSVWGSFNGWLTAVTGGGPDAAMIGKLSEHPRLAAAFLDLLRRREFQETIEGFAAWWPIFNVQHVRRFHGPNAPFAHARRDEFYDAYINDLRLRRRPEGWVYGQTPRWSDILWACYQVRCNFFHGDKSPANDADRAIVSSAGDSLRLFIGLSNLYAWSSEDRQRR